EVSERKSCAGQKETPQENEPLDTGGIVKRSVAGTTTGLVRVGARAAATLLAGGLLTLAGQGIAQAAEYGPASAPAGTHATATGAGPDSLTEVAAGAAADPDRKSVV